jgi:hypothetical protein
LRHVVFDLSEKAQTFLTSVALATLRERFAVGRVERGKNLSGAAASMIVGHRFEIAQTQPQNRQGAFQRLNSARLINAEH